MSKTKLSYAIAKDLAGRIARELSPACARIEIAGSVRREKPEIGDIEIVCIPNRQLNLFNEPGASLLDICLEELIANERITKGDRWGTNYKKFHPAAAPDLSVDLFITTPEQWGVIYTIRTGSAAFSHKLVTPKSQGGLLPSHLKVSGGRLWNGGEALHTPEEEDVFQAAGLTWLAPADREVGTFEVLV